MARAAFLMDKLMRRVGLNGRSFIPLLSSFACAIPAIIATRSIDNQKDRLITILITPIIPCSARAPIYTLLISTFIPKYLIFGVLNLQGLVMFCVYLIGIIIALIVGFIMKLFITKNIATHHYSIIELPSYKLPILRNVILELLLPIKSFIFKAGGVIVAVMTLLWALSNFPLHAGINNSLVALIAKFISPIFIPIGFNWQIIAALIPGFMAREIVVSALGAIYAIANSDNNVLASLSSMLHSSWSIATGLSLLTWYIFAPQCLSTLAIVRRETNNLYITFIMFAYQLLLAYVSAFLVYNLFAS